MILLGKLSLGNVLNPSDSAHESPPNRANKGKVCIINTDG